MIRTIPRPWRPEAYLWIVMICGLVCGYGLGTLVTAPKMPTSALSLRSERVQTATRPKSRPMRVPRVLAAGIASWYDLPGNLTASGEVFRSNLATCARPNYTSDQRPYWVRVEVQPHGPSARCRVNDRGPNGIPGRVIDVSPVVRDELGFTGLTNVRVYAE